MPATHTCTAQLQNIVYTNTIVGQNLYPVKDPYCIYIYMYVQYSLTSPPQARDGGLLPSSVKKLDLKALHFELLKKDYEGTVPAQQFCTIYCIIHENV